MKELSRRERRRRARYLRAQAAITEDPTLARLLEQRADRLTARKRAKASS